MKSSKLCVLFFAALLMAGSVSCFAQSDTPLQSPKGYLDLSLAGMSSSKNGSVFSSAVSWQRLHGVALKKRFFVGYGARLTSYFGQDGNYITAPAKVSEGNFLKAQNQTKLDTMVFGSGQINSLNLSIHLGYSITPKFTLGFNIDALGFSFGGEKKGTFYALSQGQTPTEQTAKPTSFNLLLTGDYDIGSLNSEIYAAYKLNERLGLRAGLSFLFSEYTTSQKLAFDNDRFRRKTLAPMLALSYHL
ncbi:MAG: hypothetical protein EAZ57_01125 [Cytophagales bacterium]|nr:MAG: hypothetical protein EAZ67_02150 [Cytophagales bacterium]TAF62052.1 MAG: hypothetical protein EAZ57_01125 [Cytophagales bacterium]